MTYLKLTSLFQQLDPFGRIFVTDIAFCAYFKTLWCAPGGAKDTVRRPSA